MRTVIFLCLLAAPATFADEPDGPDDEHAPPLAAPVLQPPPPFGLPTPETAARPHPPAPDVLREIDRLERSGRRMKAGGAVMIALGAALELSGQILVLHTELAQTQRCSARTGVCTSDLDTTELGVGIAAGLAAGGLLYGGVPLLGAGGARMRRAQALRAQLGLSLGGARLSVEF